MINCFSHISTEKCARRYSETRSRSNVSGAYTCWKTLIKLTFLMERLYQLTEGWYQNISLLPVLRTDSLNSLAEAVCVYVRERVSLFLSHTQSYRLTHTQKFWNGTALNTAGSTTNSRCCTGSAVGWSTLSTSHMQTPGQEEHNIYTRSSPIILS